ncbi:CHAD domain-containing protein [Rhizobium ruizarguesonis]|uniref:CHAD domain-containing protein n=1 Tax=Rhizobium ruizarguesonis TaxID=2081791 RepID=UPI002961FF5C|nr:CHAD domain-containing protein [Rhizobium ruizarguesonis]
MAAASFRQFRLNEDILLLRRNSESLHQARVALRRLRSAFSQFKPLLKGDEPSRLQGELNTSRMGGFAF